MQPVFFVPETVTGQNASGPVLELESETNRIFEITLGVTRALEQQSLDVSVWGSSDMADFGTRPLISFPQKFYCGTYTLILDLSKRPEIRWIQAQWKMSRWGRGSLKPQFGFYVFAQSLKAFAAAR